MVQALSLEELQPINVIGAGSRRRRRCERKQKQRCRTGLRTKLIPDEFLAVRSIVHKMDELELYICENRYVHHCCVIFITETWLHQSIPDTAVQLAGRNKSSGKSRGDRLCLYIHNEWTNNSEIVDTHCSPDLVYTSVKC